MDKVERLERDAWRQLGVDDLSQVEAGHVTTLQVEDIKDSSWTFIDQVDLRVKSIGVLDLPSDVVECPLFLLED